MAKVMLGNHSSVIVPRQDRDSIRKFYCDVLGGKITKEENERDFLRQIGLAGNQIRQRGRNDAEDSRFRCQEA